MATSENVTGKPVSIQRLPIVRERVGGVDASTLWRWERDGKFPKRVTVGPNISGWLESDVTAWIEERAAERFSR